MFQSVSVCRKWSLNCLFVAYISDEWEIPRDKIDVGRELGQGSFGMVHEGIARDVVKGKHAAKVAIKVSSEPVLYFSEKTTICFYFNKTYYIG